MNRRKVLALFAAVAGTALLSAAVASAATISGAGSTLVNPIVQTWIPAWGTAFGYSVSYASVGSGTGIQDISAGSVNFGASDAPMTTSQAAGCDGGNCVEIPWVLTGVTLSYNVPGAPADLHLDGAVILGIFEGTITNWDDPKIAALNPKATFPNLAITPVHRSDGSGDTYAFTNYLSDISPGATGWAGKVGYATTVTWPGGVGANGSSGIAAAVSSTPGAIGYIPAAYALPNHLKVAAIKNAAGVYATPGLKDIEAAAGAFPKPTSATYGVEMHIVDPPKSDKTAYPISTYSYVIVPKTSPYATELRKMIFWALTTGDKTYGPKLIFAPALPKAILTAAEKTLDEVTCPSSGCS